MKPLLMPSPLRQGPKGLQGLQGCQFHRQMGEGLAVLEDLVVLGGYHAACAPPQPRFDSQRSIENRPLPCAITARAMPMASRWYSKPSPWPVLYQSMKKPFF